MSPQTRFDIARLLPGHVSALLRPAPLPEEVRSLVATPSRFTGPADYVLPVRERTRFPSKGCSGVSRSARLFTHPTGSARPAPVSASRGTIAARVAAIGISPLAKGPQG